MSSTLAAHDAHAHVIDDEQTSPANSQKKQKKSKPGTLEEHRNPIAGNHFITLTHEQSEKHCQAATASVALVASSFQQLQQCTQASSTYDLYNNAKYEDIARKSVLPRYDGTAKNLILYLNKNHMRCSNESWYSAIFVNQDGIY